MDVELDDDQRAMLGQLAERPATSKELAEALDVSLDTIHSYVRELRPAGLIRREVRGGEIGGGGGRTVYMLTQAGRQRLD